MDHMVQTIQSHIKDWIFLCYKIVKNFRGLFSTSETTGISVVVSGTTKDSTNSMVIASVPVGSEIPAPIIPTTPVTPPISVVSVTAITVVGLDTVVSGQNLQLNVGVTPINAADKTVTWPKEITEFTQLTGVNLDTDDNIADLETLKASGKLAKTVTINAGTTTVFAIITDWTGAFGNIEPLIEIVKEILGDLSNRDIMQMDEKNVKMMFLTLLGVDSTYFIKSEDENNNGYVDLILKRKVQLKDITKFQWIIELKYIKESDRNTLEKAKEQGLKQLKMYGESKMVQEELGKEGLKKVLIIVVGKKDIYTVNLN